MAKTIRKQTFTEDLSKYRRFLEASDVNIAASIATMQQEMNTHRKICALIDKFSSGKPVEKQDFTNLIESSCPDFVTLNAFEKLNGGFIVSLEDLFDKPSEEVVLDCSKMKCETCWKNYINQMARLLNKSFVDIKMYAKPEDDDGNTDPEN